MHQERRQVLQGCSCHAYSERDTIFSFEGAENCLDQILSALAFIDSIKHLILALDLVAFSQPSKIINTQLLSFRPLDKWKTP